MLANASRSAPFVVIVDFEIRPDRFETFLAIVRENARISLIDEEACREFQVLLPSAEDDRSVSLYEVYDDADAFGLHLKTPHFLRFDSDTKEMVVAKAVRSFSMLPQDDSGEVAAASAWRAD